MEKMIRFVLVMVFLTLFIPLTAFASSGKSGLVVARYKVEGAETISWTDLPISSSSNQNTYDFSLNEPGVSVVTLYAEDRAGNQNYQIKSFTITEGMEDAPVKSIEYRLRGATTKDWTRYEDPFYIKEEGVTFVDVRVEDEAGNITNHTQDVKLDKTKPVNVEAIISLD